MWHQAIDMQQELIARNSTELFRFCASDIICIKADGNYCEVTLSNGKAEVLPFKLGHMEELCQQQLGAYSNNFIRIGRSHMINTEYICNINIPERHIWLRTPMMEKVKVSNIPADALKALKAFMERNL